MNESADRSRVDLTADLLLQVSPEPTDDERDALLATLAILIAEPDTALSAGRTQAMPPRWALAGREAAFEARRIRGQWRRP